MSGFTCEIDILNDENNEFIFDIKGNKDYGFDKSIINSLRRIILSDIPTVGFRYVDKDEINSLKIIKNTTALHNEFIMHRLSLIPLYINPSDYTSLLFHLKVENKGDHPLIKITSEHFQIYPLKENISFNKESIFIDNYDLESPFSKEKKDQILRPLQMNDKLYYTLITELKSNQSKKDIQELEIYGAPVLSNSNENVSFQSVSCATYNYKIDDKLKDSKINEFLEIKGIEDTPENRKDIELKLGERYFHLDNKNEPYWYTMKIESQHHHSSIDIIKIGCNILIEKLNNFDDNLKNIEGEDSLIMIDQKDNIFNLIVENMGHTLGNIIQSHLVNNYINSNSNILVCGYKKTHPLETKINFTLSTKKDMNITVILETLHQTIMDLILIYEKIIDQFN